MYRSLLLLVNVFFLLSACRKPAKAPGFYYWKTIFTLDSTEKTTLQSTGAQSLYIRYFDVDWPPEDSAPVPKAPIRFTTATTGYTVVPVVFLRNRVFERSSPAAVPQLAANVLRLIGNIDSSNHIHGGPMQFDCDWTVQTKDKYFSFLRAIHEQSHQPISATIRLHQVKYPDQTGIPPVDHGILMFYNMGDINAGAGRSIYEKAVAHRYTPSLRTYPLPLDLALPIFSWGLQIRDGKVIQLLDKITQTRFENDSNFAPVAKGRFNAAQSCFKDGFYFQQGDQVKIESVSENDLKEIISEVHQHSTRQTGQLIFFDLDSQNLQQYDANAFKEILDYAQ